MTTPFVDVFEDDRMSRLPLAYGALIAMTVGGRDMGLEFRLLGPLEVVNEGNTLPLGGPRQRALLALLLLRANEVVSRDRLVDGLWGERPPETAANALQVAVHGLRKLLGPDRITTRGAGYLLRIEPGELDLDRFAQLVAAGLVREALALWRGEALADLQETPFGRAESARLEEARMLALEDRIDVDLELAHHADLVGELEALIDEHPYRERLRGQLMLALYRSGRQAEALDAYQRMRATLVDQLGVDPSPALQELERAILRQDPSLILPPSLPSHPTNLPTPPTGLIGRDFQLIAATALLRDPGVRLVTFTGPGGTGKTRLAVEIGSDLLPELPDGVFFVDLAALRDSELVAPTIAGVLAVPESGSRSIAESLKQALRNKHLLLILDNFERVAEAGGLVSELLAAASRLKVLVTSRAVLRLSGEHEYPVPPLPVPGPQQTQDVEALERTEAVALFVARARATRHDFRLTRDNAPAVAEICIALDGLPLALELAAARSNVLDPVAMLERLEHRLDLLTAGPLDVPARQQTLRAAIDWSHDLLGARDRALLANLAVFSGGWTLWAAEAVCNADVDGLASLVDQSLVRHDETDDGEQRFRMLETIREYALERLVAEGESESVRRRHTEHFLELAERLELKLREETALATIERDHDNFRAALTFAARSGAPDLRLRLCAALWRFWYVRGFLSEGRAQLESALEHDSGHLPDRRAAALRGVAVFARVQGDCEAAVRFADESLALYRSLDDEAGAILALNALGLAAEACGDLSRAKACHEEGGALARKLGRTLEEGASLANLGDVAIIEGDYERARSLYRDSLVRCREAGFTGGIAIALVCLGIVALRHDDDPNEAARHFGESLQLCATLGFKERIAFSLAGLAAVSAGYDRERAARLLGAADALLEEIGARAESSWEGRWLAEMTEPVRALADEPFTAAFELGRSSPQAIVQEALDFAPSPAGYSAR